MLIRAKAPLRISFAGGGTDVPPFPEREGGCVLNATIDRYAWGTLRPRNDNKIQIDSVDMNTTLSCDVGARLKYDGNLDLVKAVIRKFGGRRKKGFELFLQTEAPPGSGLGSSSSLMVALVGLMKEFRNLSLTAYDAAELAYILERKELGIRGGLQDQYAATFGGFNFIEFEKDRVIVNPLRINRDVINELEHNLLLCHTGKSRLSAGIIEDQTDRYERQDSNALDGLRQQKALAIEMKNLLLRRRLEDFGALLHTAWEFKKKLSPRISNTRIDELYEKARKEGALGGKITGAGGGGYMLFYCGFERKHRIADSLRKLGAVPTEFAFEFQGLETWRVK